MVRRTISILVTMLLLALGGAQVLANGAQEQQAQEELPTLKILIGPAPGVNYDLGDNPALDAIKERTGYSFVVDSRPAEQALQKVNLVLASGEDYDWIQVGFAGPSALFNWIDNGVIQPLEDLIDAHGPVVRDLYSEEIWDAVTINGSIWTVPEENMPRYWMGTAIRTDWLQAVGMDTPETTEEMYQVLKAFKEQDPGGVGTDRVIPYSVGSGLLGSNYNLLGSFGLIHDWIERDGRLVNRVETEEMKDYIRFMRRLYREGLLDADLAVNTSNLLREKINQGLVGMAEYHWSNMFSTRDLFAEEIPGAQFDFIPTPAGPGGTRQAFRDEGINVTGVAPASSDNAEHVIKYLNAFYSDENLVYLYLGEEGTHWRFDDGDNRVPINPAFDDERGMMFQYAFTEPGKTLYPLWLTRVNKVASMGVAYRDMGEVHEGHFVSDPLANAFYLPIHDQYDQALDQMVNDELMVMILGDQPMEEWDEFVQRWREAGGEESTDEVNEWYQSQ